MFQENTVLLLQAGALAWTKFSYEEKIIWGSLIYRKSSNVSAIKWYVKADLSSRLHKYHRTFKIAGDRNICYILLKILVATTITIPFQFLT